MAMLTPDNYATLLGETPKVSDKFGVSSSYIEQQKALHPVAASPSHQVWVTGLGRQGSIAEAIAAKLGAEDHEVVRLDNRYDVRNRFVFPMQGTALVSCHGTTHLDWIEDQPRGEIENQISTNLTGSILLSQAFIQASINTPWKKYIIFVGSMAAFSVLNASSVYCASKAGLAHYVKCIGWELAPKGFLVFGVHPSNVIDTPMAEDTIKGIMRYRGISREAAEAYWGSVCPMDRWLTKDDIARLVSTILRGDLDYLSGSNIQMAGGQR